MSNQFDWTEQSKPLDCPINLIGQSNQIEQQSISKLTNQKNKSKEQVKSIKATQSECKDDRNCIDWRNPFGDEVSLGVAGWKTMADRLPEILKVLGVSA